MELKSLITKAGSRFEETIKKRGEDWDIRRRGKEFKVLKLLFAAGENIEAAPKKVKNKINPQDKPCLSYLCREAIREHLLELDLHENLFIRVPRLNLSEELQNFLLFNMSTDEQDKN